MKHALLVILCSFLWTISASAQAPFYQGKTIRVIVGTPSGNLYDFWARLIVEHLGKTFSPRSQRKHGWNGRKICP